MVTIVTVCAEILIIEGKPTLILKKKISDPKKIKYLVDLMLMGELIPAEIIIKDKFRFHARLKQLNLIEKID